MAKMNKGIFGPISGKIGKIVAATWNGIGYIRQAPTPVKKTVKRSAGQIANQQKMKFVNDLLIPFHAFVMVGFQNEAEGKTALSAAYSVNFHQAITGVYPNLGVDYPKLCLSKGKLPGRKTRSWSLSEKIPSVCNGAIRKTRGRYTTIR